MIIKLDLNNMETVKKILKLQQASYKIEADIIGFYDIPPLKDSIDTLKACDESFYGYMIDEALAGLISYKIIEDVLDIHRVAINPLFFRKGIADKLIKFVESFNCNINKIVVCTGMANLPAVNLYLKNGYKKKRDIEISKGIYLTEFEKVLKLN